MSVVTTRAIVNGVINYWGGINASGEVAIVFAALFGVGAIFHAFQLWRYRAWYFIAFVAGAFMMSIGYIFRNVSINDPENLAPYVVQVLFILLPPSLYAATIYMIYGRIVLLVNAAHLSLIRPTWVTKIFVCSDALAFIVQAGGGSMLTMEGQEATGKNILLVGLYVQLASFAFFLCISAVFYMRVRRAKGVDVPCYGRYHWTTMLKVLYFAAACIILRCVFRLVEFSANNKSLQTNEVWMLCFDAAPMMVVQCVFNVVHGGMVLPAGGVQKFTGVRSDESQYELSRGESV